jgi:hypothetical protein
MRTVFECYNCGYRYSAAWYEPNWLAKKQYLKDHGEFCGSVKANAMQQSWWDGGVQAERERIIKLLELYANKKCDEECAYICECFGKHEALTFIALIKGENK